MKFIIVFFVLFIGGCASLDNIDVHNIPFINSGPVTLSGISIDKNDEAKEFSFKNWAIMFNFDIKIDNLPDPKEVTDPDEIDELYKAEKDREWMMTGGRREN